MIFLDITMIGIDIYLFIYFIKSAMATSTISFRIMLCLAATFEIFLLKEIYLIFYLRKKVVNIDYLLYFRR